MSGRSSKKGGQILKKEYHKDTDSTHVSFEAGRVCDDFGCPMPFWRCRVAYTWCEYRQVYWVYAIQTVGFGVVDDKVTREIEMGSLQEVNHFLDYLKDVEGCYKKVYGE